MYDINYTATISATCNRELTTREEDDIMHDLTNALFHFLEGYFRNYESVQIKNVDVVLERG